MTIITPSIGRSGASGIWSQENFVAYLFTTPDHIDADRVTHLLVAEGVTQLIRVGDAVPVHGHQEVPHNEHPVGPGVGDDVVDIYALSLTDLEPTGLRERNHLCGVG